jgi:hypothetical protein
MNKYTAAAKAFVEATQGDVVSDEEIDRRARLCKPCPGRVKTTGVGRVSQILGALANKHKVPKEIADFSCVVCKCNLQLLIPAKEPHVDSPKEKARRVKVNARCWNLSENK